MVSGLNDRATVADDCLENSTSSLIINNTKGNKDTVTNAKANNVGQKNKVTPEKKLSPQSAPSKEQSQIDRLVEIR